MRHSGSMKWALLLGSLVIAVWSVVVDGSAAATTASAPRPDPREEFGYPSEPDGHAIDDGDSVSTAIVGGSPIAITDAPWQVLLADVDPPYYGGQGYFAFCGGSIVDRLWIVTAAHCVDDSRFWPYLQIAAGSTNKDGIALSSFIDVAEVFVHEAWNPETSDNDVALLKLASPLALDGSTKSTIALPWSVGATWPSSGVNSFISGWGTMSFGGSSPNQLRGATVQVLSGRDSAVCGSYGDQYRRASMLCAGVPDGGIDTCQGDSGGPLAIMVDGRWTLAGVTSWGNGCAFAGYPGIYTRVTSFLDWIAARISRTPGPPTITSVDGGNKTLTVVFSAPDLQGASAITNYAYSVDGGRWTTLRPARTSGPIVLTRLSNGRSYSIRLAAINSFGRGESSEVSSGTPRPDPPSAPTIRSAAPGNGQVTLTVRAPSNNGGAAITGYEVSTDEGVSWSSASVGRRGNVIVGGLTNGERVSIMVRAVNSGGAGAQSNTVSTTPRRSPDAPAISGVSRGNRTLRVEFSAPTFDGGAAVKNYEYSLNNGRWSALRPASVNGPIVIARVIDSRAYSVRIRAVNAAGAGAASVPFSVAAR